MKPGYKQTEIGVIPEDWEVKFLTAFGAVVSGGTPSTSVSEYWDGDIAWCTPSDISKTARTTIAKTERCITAKGLFNSAAVLLPPGCVLLCTRATIGDSKINSVAMATNQGFKNIVPKNCNISFLFYLLQTKKQQMLEKAIGSTFLEISKSALCSIPMQYPPIPEQQRIAEALSDVDELIASLEKLIEKKKAIKQGVMLELLTGKRRLPGFSGEWKSVCLSDIGHFIKGSGISRADTNSGKLPAVRYGELYTKHTDYVKKYYSHISCDVAANAVPVTFGAILFAASGETKEEIGKCAAIIEKHTVYAGGDILIFIPDKSTHPVFLGTLLNIPEVCKQKAQRGQGDAIVHIHADSLSEIEVQIPEYDEQAAIADVLLSADREIDLMEMKITKARQVKQGMMQQLLTGAVRLT